MPTRETPLQRVRRESRELVIRLGAELRRARVSAGLSQREVGRRTGLSHSVIGRIERGEVRHLSIERLEAIAVVVGLHRSVKLYPSGSPVRDRAHLALLGRLRVRLHPSVRLRLEVPMPDPGDPRSVDGWLDGPMLRGMAEAETRVDDIQEVVRRLRAKQRDLGGRRAILLLADTRHNRAVLRAHPELRTEFPVGSRACLAALAKGRDPGGDAIVLL
jgi:transcriptional regulator with XRE-family HTH domain